MLVVADSATLLDANHSFGYSFINDQHFRYERDARPGTRRRRAKVPLSDHEQKLLEQIEQALYAEDPKFAASVRKVKSRRPRGRRWIALSILERYRRLGLGPRRATGQVNHPRHCRFRSDRRWLAPMVCIRCAADRQMRPRCPVLATRRPATTEACAAGWKTACAVVSTKTSPVVSRRTNPTATTRTSWSSIHSC